MGTVEIISAKKIIFYVLTVVCIINIQASLDDIETVEIKEGLDKNRRKIEKRIFAIVQKYDRYAQTNDLLIYLKIIGYYVKF